MDQIELISFKLCPFIQRTKIALLELGIEHKVTYIDLQNKPDWFLKISPLGKVPILKVGNDILFESSVINEFVNDIYKGDLLPNDPLIRAKARGWIEYSEVLFFGFVDVFTSKTQEELVENSKHFKAKLQFLENVINPDPFFLGEKFSLVDISFAPIFVRLDFLQNSSKLDIISEFPKISYWSKSLLLKESVRNSSIFDQNPHLKQVFLGMLKKRSSILA